MIWAVSPRTGIPTWSVITIIVFIWFNTEVGLVSHVGVGSLQHHPMTPGVWSTIFVAIGMTTLRDLLFAIVLVLLDGHVLTDFQIAGPCDHHCSYYLLHDKPSTVLTVSVLEHDLLGYWSTGCHRLKEILCFLGLKLWHLMDRNQGGQGLSFAFLVVNPFVAGQSPKWCCSCCRTEEDGFTINHNTLIVLSVFLRSACPAQNINLLPVLLDSWLITLSWEFITVISFLSNTKMLEPL